MSRIEKNTKEKSVVAERNETAHANWMGGASWDISNPLTRLRIAASSCFFGEPMYYHRDSEDKRYTRYDRYDYNRLSDSDVKRLREVLDAIDPQDWRGKSPTDMMESAIDAALDFSVEETLKVAVALRNEDNIRTTPQVILVRAAHHKDAKGTGLIRKYAKDIVSRADEPGVCVAYSRWRFGKTLPNSLKKALAGKLSTYDEYALSKYRGESAGSAIKLVDVVNLVHPKATEALGKLMRDELRVTDSTWEGLVSTKGSTKEVWTEAVEKMGHMALLRNIRNLLEKDVDPDLWLEKMVKTAAKGRQLPFRYFSAYKANENCGNPKVLDAIEDCLTESLGNLPKFEGRVMSLSDNSGSAWGTMTSSAGTMHVAEIANLTGVITGKIADEGHVGVFGDTLKTVEVRKKSSVFDDFKKVCKTGKTVGGGTEHGIWEFWRGAIDQKQHWDHVFVYSDMQAGHGGLYGRGIKKSDIWGGSGGGWSDYVDVPKMIDEYRKKVNPNVNVYLVQMAGYQDTIVPETYNRTAILGGWGDGIFRYAARMNEIWSQNQNT